MRRLYSNVLLAAVLASTSCAAQAQSPKAAAPSAPAAVAAKSSHATAAQRAELVKKLEDDFNDPDFKNAFWGVYVKSLDSGEVWYERNSDKLFMPASNEKILTTSSALRTLGKDFHFETKLSYRGTVANGKLTGDLVVRGNGDPTLYTKFFKSPTEVFDGWAKKLKEAGITHISGDVIGDDNAWSDTHVHDSWPQDLSDWYYAEFGPLQLNENCVDITITPPAKGGKEIKLEPNLPSQYYQIQSELTVVEGEKATSNVNLFRDRGTNVIHLTGTVAAGGKSLEITPTISNPTKWYVTVLKETLAKNGIQVDGEAADCDDVEGFEYSGAKLTPILTHQSPPLEEILRGLMKRSQNLYAESMVMTMGEKATGKGSYSSGSDVVEGELKAMGVTRDMYSYRDGSGLSRYDNVSPRALVTINEAMAKSPLDATWEGLFPIAGVDGTLAKRMKGTPAEKNVHAKTGTISGVRGLSGYVTTADGERLLFSFLVNGHKKEDSDTNRVTDTACALLAGFTAAK